MLATETRFNGSRFLPRVTPWATMVNRAARTCDARQGSVPPSRTTGSCRHHAIDNQLGSFPKCDPVVDVHKHCLHVECELDTGGIAKCRTNDVSLLTSGVSA